MTERAPITITNGFPPTLPQMLMEQAGKCQTAGGSALLMAIYQAFAFGPGNFGKSELWEVADHLATQAVSYDPAVDAIEAERSGAHTNPV